MKSLNRNKDYFFFNILLYLLERDLTWYLVESMVIALQKIDAPIVREK